MRLLADQPAPAWVPFVILLVPITIMALLLRRSGRFWIRARQVKRTDARRHGPQEVAVGSAEQIADPGGYTSAALLQALAVKPEYDGPLADGTPFDDAYYATMLGLRARLVSGGESTPTPSVYWGNRPHGQVFVRSGPDESFFAMTDRHYRHITALRVDAPTFEISSQEGVLCVSDEAPAGVSELVGGLAPDPVIWHEVSVVAGAEGIVCSRPSTDALSLGWVYDLWLSERIAQQLGLTPLRHVRLGPTWKLPYRMGKRPR